ncbi:type II secretion system F family protein [Marinomonas atlantica]|uniref:type II secretion system F family protein n=1 Tax=Marinomonas atlantica TaxID=1806668 RepID=UPI0008306E39|nr:type II secretion system F family protein [Marinomonas atlantica]
MIWFFIFQVFFGVVAFLYFFRQRRHVKQHEYLQEYVRVTRPKNTKSIQQVVDLRSLIGYSVTGKIYNTWLNQLDQLGAFPRIKLMIFIVLMYYCGYFFNENFLRSDNQIINLLFIIVGLFVGYQYLQGKQEKDFEDTFPVALNMMTSAVSSGESLTQAIAYVGSALEGRVAQEFTTMAKRLQLGEAPEDVFRKACARLPYPMFYFFVITLRANIERGGQLRDIIQRLNKLMFNIRSVEKKKSALTAEARTSAKIVAAVPFLFLIIMRFFSPENFDFIMSDPKGRLLLYYMLVSETVGIVIVWGLMRSAR